MFAALGSQTEIIFNVYYCPQFTKSCIKALGIPTIRPPWAPVFEFERYLRYFQTKISPFGTTPSYSHSVAAPFTMYLFTAFLASILLFVARGSAYRLPTCGAESCLPISGNGTYHDCPLWHLGCLCKLEQSQINEYVELVAPCMADRKGCTDGAYAEYKDLFSRVCGELGRSVDLGAWP
ncbi:hypothetical protein CC78DRAFT_577157 [Lojkania enalia]|uniref:CFEM domain-containing protein n=1 Tax=Lojkania enalia TaxID=147567 RepID=A0A9P4N5S1_9PLEO|nr:hypothetical protein CC78DRAFT_577157 [Didymosphaeria enalia]